MLQHLRRFHPPSWSHASKYSRSSTSAHAPRGNSPSSAEFPPQVVKWCFCVPQRMYRDLRKSVREMKSWNQPVMLSGWTGVPSSCVNSRSLSTQRSPTAILCFRCHFRCAFSSSNACSGNLIVRTEESVFVPFQEDPPSQVNIATSGKSWSCGCRSRCPSIPTHKALRAEPRWAERTESSPDSGTVRCPANVKVSRFALHRGILPLCARTSAVSHVG